MKNLAMADEAIYSAVKTVVDSAIHLSSELAFDLSLFPAVRLAVALPIDSIVYSTVDLAVGSTIDSTVYSTVDLAVGSTIDSTINSTIEPTLDFKTLQPPADWFRL